MIHLRTHIVKVKLTLYLITGGNQHIGQIVAVSEVVRLDFDRLPQRWHGLRQVSLPRMAQTQVV